MTKPPLLQDRSTRKRYSHWIKPTRLVMPDLFRHPHFGKTQRMRERQPCVYILASCFNGTLYIGVTSDLVARLYQHREGITGGFTKRYGVKRLVYFEMADTMEGAIMREKALKKWPREWKRNLIERENPAWNDLATGLGFEPLS